MASLSDIPEPVLEDILFRVAAGTKYFSWLFTLRLVNRQFNDSLLYVVFFQRPRSLQLPPNEIPCDMKRRIPFDCSVTMDSHRKVKQESIFVRYVFLSLWARPNPIGLDAYTARLFYNLREALRLLGCLVKGVDPTQAQLQLYPICTRNKVFNDFAGTILAEALHYCVEPTLITSLDYLSLPGEVSICERREPIRVLTMADRSPAFWVALSACVIGNVAMVHKYSREAALDQEASSNRRFVSHEFLYLKVAARCAKFDVVKSLLERHPDVMSDKVPHGSGSVLEAALRSQDQDVLEILLRHISDPDSAIEHAVLWNFSLIGKDETSAAILRTLTRYLSPAALQNAPSTSRVMEMMIYYASMQDDISFLADLVESGVTVRWTNFETQIGNSFPNALGVAAREGNLSSMCFLFDHGFFTNVSPSGLKWAIQRAAVSAVLRNHSDCYRELRRRYPDAIYMDCRAFEELGYTKDMEDIMRDFMAKFDGVLNHIDRSALRTLASYPTCGQSSLYRAIHGLRPRNVEFLLGQGVIPYQGEPLQNTFEIPWPYFNKNRTAFDHVQAVLEAYNLPKLNIVV